MEYTLFERLFIMFYLGLITGGALTYAAMRFAGKLERAKKYKTGGKRR